METCQLVPVMCHSTLTAAQVPAPDDSVRRQSLKEVATAVSKGSALSRYNK